MRLLRLDFGDDLHRLDLHPVVTVVDDLSPDQQQQLFTAVRELARGTARSFRGLVEHRGVLTEVQRPGDLRVEEQRRCPYDVVLHLDDHLRAGEPSGLEAEIDQCRRQAEIDAVRLEELRADLKPWLWAEVVLLRSQVESAGSATMSTRDSGPPSDAPPRLTMPTRESRATPPGSTAGAIRAGDLPEPTRDPAGGDAELERLEAVVAAIGGVDSQPRYVEHLSPEIDELLGRWSVYVEVREHHGGHLAVLEHRLDEARDGVRRAEAALVEAEEAAKPVLLSTAEETRLEALAERAESAAGGWRRRSSGLSPEEQHELDGLMAKVGVSSWTEYSVFRLAPDVAPELQEAIEQARRELTEAETRLHQAELALGSDPVANELENEHSLLRNEATAHLGAVVPNDIGAGLRELAERLDNPEWVEAVDRLDQLLHREGVTDTLLAGDDPDQLIDWARLWVDHERSRLGVDPASAHAVDGAAPLVTDTETVLSPRPVAGAASDDVEAMRRALGEAERKLVRHRRALDRIKVVRARAAASRERLGRLRHLADQVGGPGGSTADEVIAVVSPVINQIRSDLGYAVPIVMSGSLPHMQSTEVAQLMDRIEDLANRVQVIVVADRSEAVDWAVRSGPTRALHSTGSARSLWSTLPQ